MNFNMDIKIRKVKASDWLLMKKLLESIWDHHRPLFKQIDSAFESFVRPVSKKKFLKLIRQRNSYFILAEYNSKPIGYIFARVHRDPSDPKTVLGNLSQIFIIKKFRGKGVSDLLWNETLEWFKSRKVDFLQLYVTVNNGHAVRVYKKWGFKPFMTRMVKKF